MPETQAPAEKPTVPVRRLFLLTLLTAAVAFAVQATLAATDPPFAGALRLLVTPLVAGAVVLAWLRPYPLAGRLRLAAMVTAAMFLVGLGL